MNYADPQQQQQHAFQQQNTQLPQLPQLPFVGNDNELEMARVIKKRKLNNLLAMETSVEDNRICSECGIQFVKFMDGLWTLCKNCTSDF